MRVAALFELLREAVRAVRFVLLRGGPGRSYAPADHAQFGADLEALAELFAPPAGGAERWGAARVAPPAARPARPARPPRLTRARTPSRRRRAAG